ncbi:hypothetical protein ACNKHR_19740 [Shigella flexneri]
MPGGTFRKKSASFHGQLARMPSSISLDKLLMGSRRHRSTMRHNHLTRFIPLRKAMCNAAREVILMADCVKLGRKGPNVICSLESVDKLITDAGMIRHFVGAGREKE